MNVGNNHIQIWKTKKDRKNKEDKEIKTLVVTVVDYNVRPILDNRPALRSFFKWTFANF